MKFRLKQKKNFWHNHLWFAWYPVRTEDNFIVWLEKVQRQRVPSGTDPEVPYVFKYLIYKKCWPF